MDRQDRKPNPKSKESETDTNVKMKKSKVLKEKMKKSNDQKEKELPEPKESKTLNTMKDLKTMIKDVERKQRENNRALEKINKLVAKMK